MQIIRKGDTLKSQVYEYLRTQIILGKIQSGARLIETKLAIELNISRSPIREALRMLEKDGLLQVNASGGLIVVKPTIQDYQQLYECRIELEPIAAYYAAQRRTSEQLAEMERYLSQNITTLESMDVKKVHDANVNFHEAIAAASHNIFLSSMVSKFRGVNSFYRKAFLVEKPLHAENAAKEHLHIYQMILRQDADKAKKAMREHIESDYKLFLEFQKQLLEVEK